MDHCDRLNSPAYVRALMFLRSKKRMAQFSARVMRRFYGGAPAPANKPS